MGTVTMAARKASARSERPAQERVGARPLLEVNSVQLSLHVQKREMKNYLSKQNNRLDSRDVQSGGKQVTTKWPK